MKAIMNTIVKVSGGRLAVIVLLLIGLSFHAEAQFQQYSGAVAPQTSFQSTSTMVGTGSAYSSNPMLNTNGTATYNGASYSPNKAKKEEIVFDGELPNKPSDTPLGDVVLPLMLCALLYIGWQIRSKRKKKAYHFS